MILQTFCSLPKGSFAFVKAIRQPWTVEAKALENRLKIGKQVALQQFFVEREHT
jgi:hypothetical protein